MSNNTSKIEQIPKKLERLSLTDKVKVIVSNELADKIKFLCMKISKVEWSGILFYTTEGSIKKPSTFKVILKDILLMDKGTATYTSFDWDEDVVSYKMDNPDAIDWYMGHIHSHNTMSVFFSGTDWSELNDNCPNHNIYLSVIVNNYFEVTGKIAFTGEPQKKVFYMCKTEGGEDYKLAVTLAEPKTTMLVYDCDFDAPFQKIPVPAGFEERISFIEKKVAAKEKSAVTNPVVQKDYRTNFYNELLKENATSKFPDFKPKGKQNLMEMDEFDEEVSTFFPGTEEEPDLTPAQKFATYLMRLGNVDGMSEDIEDAVVDIVVSEISESSLAESVLNNYVSLYKTFFDDLTISDEASFILVLEAVIEELEDLEPSYPVLKQTIKGLIQFGDAFTREKINDEQITA